MLQIQHLSIGYRHRTVLTSLNATVPTGTLTALIGRNGSGKSTLIRSVCGLLPPLSGSIRVGHEASGRLHTPGPRDIAVVLSMTRYATPMLTVRDAVALGRLPYTGITGRLKDEDHAAVQRAITRCKISHLTERRIADISDGERQRTMIARALAQETPIIVLDEPTAFLDYSARVQTMLLLQQLCSEENKTLLFSTHDLEIALPMVRRLWALLPTGSDTPALIEGTAQQLMEDGTLQHIFPEVRLKKHPE